MTHVPHGALDLSPSPEPVQPARLPGTGAASMAARNSSPAQPPLQRQATPQLPAPQAGLPAAAQWQGHLLAQRASWNASISSSPASAGRSAPASAPRSLVCTAALAAGDPGSALHAMPAPLTAPPYALAAGATVAGPSAPAVPGASRQAQPPLPLQPSLSSATSQAASFSSFQVSRPAPVRLSNVLQPAGFAAPFSASTASAASLPCALPPQHLQQLRDMAHSQATEAAAGGGSGSQHSLGAPPKQPTVDSMQERLMSAYRKLTAQTAAPLQPMLTPAQCVQRQRNLEAMQRKYAPPRPIVQMAALAAPPAAMPAPSRLSQHQRQQLQARRDFLTSLMRHRKSLLQSLDAHRSSMGKCLKEAASIGALKAKRQAEQEARQARQQQREREQRLAALKANDMGAYEAMLKDCKTMRLRMLLEQTSRWEAKLKAMIEDKRRSGQREDRHELELKLQAARKLKADAAATAPSAISAFAAAAPCASAASPSPPSAAVESDASSSLSASGPLLSSPSSHEASGASQEGSQATKEERLAHQDDLLELVEEEVAQPSLMSGGELKAYQLTALNWLVSLHTNHLNGILADEMGLGKTIVTIALLAHLLESKRISGPFLVIAPLSTLGNWSAEFGKWAPSIKTVMYRGDRPERTELWKTVLKLGAFHVLLVSFEFMTNSHDKGKLCSVQWKYVVVDEGHRVKNNQSELARTLASKYKHVQHRLILSGTPLQNTLRELWSLLNFLLPSIFDSAESFDEWFARPFENKGLLASRAGDADAASAEALLDEEEKLLIIHRLHQILRPFLLRRLKKDVASQLPAKVEVVLKCALTPWQTLLYQRLQNGSTLATVGVNGVVRAKNMQNVFMQLRKVVAHPYLFEESNPAFQQAQFTASPTLHRAAGKFALLHRMLPKLLRTGHRVLLFSQMTTLLDVLEDYLRWKGLLFVRLDGVSKQEERAEAQSVFNKTDSEVRQRLSVAGGRKQRTRNPANDLQAMDRAHRIGQLREVRVFRLLSLSPVEEQMLERVHDKMHMEQVVIQSGRFDKHTSSEERQGLLQQILRQSIRPNQEAAAPSDEEVNRIMARSDEEFDTFQRMDQEIDAEDERVWKECHVGDSKPCPGRFITEEELPVHVRDGALLQVVQREEELMDATPARRTAAVAASASFNEADALTEREWMRCVERGLNPVAYAQRKQQRRAQATAKKGSRSATKLSKASALESGQPSASVASTDDDAAGDSADEAHDPSSRSGSPSPASTADDSASARMDDSSVHDAESAASAGASDSDASFAPRKQRPVPAAAFATRRSRNVTMFDPPALSKRGPGRPRKVVVAPSPAPSAVGKKDASATKVPPQPADVITVESNDEGTSPRSARPHARTQPPSSVPSVKRKRSVSPAPALSALSGSPRRTQSPAGRPGSRARPSPVPSPVAPPPVFSPPPGSVPALSRRDFMAHKRNGEKQPSQQQLHTPQKSNTGSPKHAAETVAAHVATKPTSSQHAAVAAPASPTIQETRAVRSKRQRR